MNTLAAPATKPSQAATAHETAGANRAPTALPTPLAAGPLPLLLCALVLALALLSYFVQVLNDHVQRGEQWRQAQRHAATSKPGTVQRRPASATDAQVLASVR